MSPTATGMLLSVRFGRDLWQRRHVSLGVLVVDITVCSALETSSF